MTFVLKKVSELYLQNIITEIFEKKKKEKEIITVQHELRKLFFILRKK